MTFTLVGSIEFCAFLQPTVDRFNAEFGDRVKDAKVLAKPAAAMPTRSDGGPSFGFWKKALREIWLWDDIDEYPSRKTLAHEACHVLDQDWLTRIQREDLMALMLPEPRKWFDQMVAGVKKVYTGLPSEAFAVYASAAFGGFDKPAYTKLFDRYVPAAEWPKLKAISLMDYGHAEPEPLPPPVVPTPPDPAQAEIERLTALLAEISQDNTELAAQQMAVAAKGKAEI